jgi:cyanophycin synthetase
VTDQLSSISQPLLPRGLRVEPDVLPLIAIAGTRGKSTVAWMLSRILRADGRSVASWLSSGVYVGGVREVGELGPWSRVVMAARHGELDLALQEMAAPTVVGAGLPENTYPMGIITTLCGNNESCLLNPDTRLERRGLEIVARSVRDDGLIIANADDFDVLEIARARGCATVLYALHRENPTLQQLLRDGGRGAWPDDGMLTIGDAGESCAIVPVAEIPATLDGAILFQVQNALAAAAAAWELGCSAATIAEALRAFAPDPEVQPAASNIVRFNGATLLIDAPMQIRSLRMLVRGIRHTPHRRRIVVSGCFPGMSDDDARDAGRILGDFGGIVLLHSENATPDRMELIKEGISAAQVPPIVLAVPDELRAIDHVLNTIAPGDVALVIADDADVVLAHLWPAPAISVGSHRKVGSAPR